MYYKLSYKTGQYIVESLGAHPNGELIQIAAVLIHPRQGDLHHPGAADFFFHERKALSYHEKRIVHPNLLKPYEGNLPDYVSSLQNALSAMEQKLKQSDDDFSRLALKNVQSLKQEYSHYYQVKFD